MVLLVAPLCQVVLAPIAGRLSDKYVPQILAAIGMALGTISLFLFSFLSAETPIEFLILDEHTAALDPKTADLIMELTDQIVKEKHLTTIMVTHNLRYAVEYGNRLVMMHEGKAILDKAGEEKASMKVEEILGLFTEISIECGN